MPIKKVCEDCEFLREEKEYRGEYMGVPAYEWVLTCEHDLDTETCPLAKEDEDPEEYAYEDKDAED